MSNIYVGNMPYDITEGQLRDLFGEFGTVDRVSIITDRETGRPRGFGFVEMADDAAAKTAIDNLNGTEMGGRALTVNEAKPKRATGGRRW